MHCFTFPSKSFSSPSSLHISPEHYLWIISLKNRPHMPFLFFLIPYVFTLSYKILRLVLIVLTCNTCCCACAEATLSEAFICSLHRLGVRPFCPEALSREFCVLPLGPNPHSCLPISQVAHLDSHRAPLLHSRGFSKVGWWWGQTASTQPPPDTPRQQLFSKKITFCLVLFMASFTLSTQTPICHHLKSPEVIHS